MFVRFSSTLAVIWSIKLMISGIIKLCLRLRNKFSIRSDELGVIHRPLLDGLLFLQAMILPVGSTPIRVKIVTIRMQIVPSSKGSSIRKLSFVESTMCAVSSVWHSHRMFIKLCHWHHFFKISMIWEVILSIKVDIQHAL